VGVQAGQGLVADDPGGQAVDVELGHLAAGGALAVGAAGPGVQAADVDPLERAGVVPADHFGLVFDPVGLVFGQLGLVFGRQRPVVDRPGQLTGLQHRPGAGRISGQHRHQRRRGGLAELAGDLAMSPPRYAASRAWMPTLLVTSHAWSIEG